MRRLATGALCAFALLSADAGATSVDTPPEAAQPAASELVTALRRARSEWSQGHGEAALEALEPLRVGLLGDHVELIRTAWLRELHRLPDSVTAAQAGLAQEPPSEVRAHLYQELAQTHLAAGELPDAYRAQRSSWEASHDSSRKAELQIELARAFERKQLPADALRLYRRTWSEGPITPVTQEAYDRDRLLTRATGAPEPPLEELLQRAERLRSAWECDRALPLVTELAGKPGLSPALTLQLEQDRAACLFQTRRYAEAAAAYGALVARRPQDHDAAIQRARAIGRQGDLELAVRELRALAKRAPPATSARARYLAATLLAEREPEASRELLLELEGQQADPEHARLARWRLAWDDYLHGRHEAAIQRMQGIASGPSADLEVQRARYWIAMARRALGRPEGEQDMRALAAELPLSYYGLLAARRAGIEPALERSFVGERSTLAAPRPHERARILLEGGLPEPAREELESWIADQRLNRELRLLAAELYHDLGDHFRAVQLVENGFGGALESGIDPRWRDAWLAAWPQPYGPSVRDATDEFGFERWLVYAVMREESTYRPEVESPAGAIGLMQIIPPTGSRIASDLGVAPFEPELLRRPEINIRFGTYYLDKLLREFDGAQPHAIAAYNAGPEAVTRWLAAAGEVELDAFVDSVPYDETRRYCRRVLRSYWIYRILYQPGTTPPQQDAAGAPRGAQSSLTVRR